MTPGRRHRWLTVARLAALAGCALLAGCRSSRPGGGGGGATRGDPLLGGRYIPKTDLPIPTKDSAGRGRDPLFTTPAGRDKAEKVEKEDRAGADLPREPFRPGPETTAAGLAGGLSRDDSSLSIGERPDRRTGGAATGRGPVMLRPRDGTAGGPTIEQVTAELRRLGATWSDPMREGGEYVVRVTVPAGEDGQVRQYEGAGATAAAAAKQALDQIKSDQNR